MRLPHAILHLYAAHDQPELELVHWQIHSTSTQYCMTSCIAYIDVYPLSLYAVKYRIGFKKGVFRRYTQTGFLFLDARELRCDHLKVSPQTEI